jgi:hypothetical protein
MIADWSTAHGETAPDTHTHTHRHTDSISRGEVALSIPLQRTETHTRPGTKNERPGGVQTKPHRGSMRLLTSKLVLYTERQY